MSNDFSLNKIKNIYDNNETGDGGFFPIGRNKKWHGGIHLNYGEKEGVFPIIDGELVAYRLNEDEITCSLSEKISDETYKQDFEIREKGKEHLIRSVKSAFSEKKGFISKYHDKIESSDSKYLAGSNNYILLRHSINSSNNKIFYFYTLYMHITPYSKYLIKNDYCIYLIEKKISKNKSSFNNYEFEGKFYVKLSEIQNQNVQPFYIKWNVLIKNMSPIVWKLNYEGKDIFPFTRIILAEKEYFKSTFKENILGLQIQCIGESNEIVRVKSRNINFTKSCISLKMMNSAKIFLYFDENNFNDYKPGLFSENRKLLFDFDLKQKRNSQLQQVVLPKADGTKEKIDSREIYYVGFIPSGNLQEETINKVTQTKIFKNCYLRYPLDPKNNPKDLYRLNKENKIIYFNKKYPQFTSVGDEVYFPTENVVLKAREDAVIDNSNELIHVSIEEYCLFVCKDDLVNNEDETYTVNKELTYPIYIVDNKKVDLDLTIYFPKDNEEDKTPEYLKKTKEIIFNNGEALLGKTFAGSKGQDGSVYDEQDKNKLTYIRLTFKNENSSFYLYGDSLNKRQEIKKLSQDNNLWITKLKWDEIKKYKKNRLQETLKVDVYKEPFADVEYLIIKPNEEWKLEILDKFPDKAIKDLKNEVLIYGMKKDILLFGTQVVSSFAAENADETYREDWKVIEKQEKIIKCIKKDYIGSEKNDIKYINEDLFEINDNLTGVIKNNDGIISDYDKVADSVLCFSTPDTNSTPIGVISLNELKEGWLECIPKIENSNFLKITGVNNSYVKYLYFDKIKLNTKKEDIFIGNDFNEKYNKNNEYITLKGNERYDIINPSNCIGTAGGFITDKNYIHFSLFTNKEFENIEMNYSMFPEKCKYYSLEPKYPNSAYVISLPSQTVKFNIYEDKIPLLENSAITNQYAEVSINELTFYMNENDFRRNDTIKSNITINDNINFKIYFYDQKNSISFGNYQNSTASLNIMKNKFFQNGRLLYRRNIYNFENKADTDKDYTNWYKVKIGNPDYKFIAKFGDYLKSETGLKKIEKIEFDKDKKQYIFSENKTNIELQVYPQPEYYELQNVKIKDIKKKLVDENMEFPIFQEYSKKETVLIKKGEKYLRKCFYPVNIGNTKYYVDEDTYKEKIARNSIKISDFFTIFPESKEKSLNCDFITDFVRLIADLNDDGKFDDKDIKMIYDLGRSVIDKIEKEEEKSKKEQKNDENIYEDYKLFLKATREACCKIPLEWDKTFYSDEEYDKSWKSEGILKEEYTVLQDIMNQSDIKEMTKSISDFKNLDNFIFYNPAYFLQKMNEIGLLNPHAKELRRVQERIINMNTIQPSPVGKGIFDVGGVTFCNHAVFLTIRALDTNYLDFTGRLNGVGGVDKPIDQAPSSYRYKVSSYWCVVLHNQSVNNDSSITELFSVEEIKYYANRGYVVIAAWEGTGGPDDPPHYATVTPQYGNISLKKADIKLCNVGGGVGIDVPISLAFGERKIPNIHFYYNKNQLFREDYTVKGNCSRSIVELENAHGTRR